MMRVVAASRVAKFSTIVTKNQKFISRNASRNGQETFARYRGGRYIPGRKEVDRGEAEAHWPGGRSSVTVPLSQATREKEELACKQVVRCKE